MNCAPSPPPIMPAIESSHTASAQGRPHCGICRVATPPSFSRQMVVFSALQSFAAVWHTVSRIGCRSIAKRLITPITSLVAV
jgi:hypothetical protein